MSEATSEATSDTAGSAIGFTMDLLGERISIAKGGTKPCPDCLGCSLDLSGDAQKLCKTCLGRGRILTVFGPASEDYKLYVALCNEARKRLGRAPYFSERENLKQTVKDRRRILRRVA